MPRATLRVRALRRRIHDRWVVDGVDLCVRSGEIVGLLGPNGAGKTVTLTMIVGLVRPTSGQILIDGEDVTALPMHRRARRGLGYLPQERSVFHGLSALDNIAAILESRHLSRSAARARARELLAEFDLTHLADQHADRLSGGEQRRLEVARSLATDPRILLFDEPFAGIDPLTIASLHDMLLGLRKRGVGILLTDHNVHETLVLCDHAYVLFDGRILAEGTPPALIDNREVRQHFLGEDFDLAEEERASLCGERLSGIPTAVPPADALS